jgi:hypothetical protein
VDDRAAERFASELYAGLLAGDDLGDAVARARLEAWSAARGSLTWGAYQCYGDPGFRLASRTSGRRPGEPKTKGDLRRRVQQLHARASDQGRSAAADPEKTKADLHKALKELAGRAVRLKSWDILADLAAAWADLSEFERAIGLYERALSRGGSEVPLRAVEQLGNLQIREACRLRRAACPDEPKIARYVAEAERRLNRRWRSRRAENATRSSGATTRSVRPSPAAPSVWVT